MMARPTVVRTRIDDSSRAADRTRRLFSFGWAICSKSTTSRQGAPPPGTRHSSQAARRGAGCACGPQSATERSSRPLAPAVPGSARPGHTRVLLLPSVIDAQCAPVRVSICARSPSESPPQMPYGSCTCRACARQAAMAGTFEADCLGLRLAAGPSRSAFALRVEEERARHPATRRVQLPIPKVGIRAGKAPGVSHIDPLCSLQRCRNQRCSNQIWLTQILSSPTEPGIWARSAPRANRPGADVS